MSCDTHGGPHPPQGTPEKLLEELVHESVDDTFVKDFLLTYRTFLESTTPILEKLKMEWENGMPAQRDRVSPCNNYSNRERKIVCLYIVKRGRGESAKL